MTELFLTICRMSIGAGIAAIVVMLGRIALKRAPKKYSYVLWVVVLFRLLCPLTIESTWSLFPDKLMAAVQEMVPTQLIMQEQEQLPVQEQMQTKTQVQTQEQVQTQASELIQVIEPDIDAENNMANGITKGMSADWIKLQWLFKMGEYVWIFGISIIITYTIMNYLFLKRRLRLATRITGNIYETDCIQTPFVLGVFHPNIYLPLLLSSEQRAFIIKHEQTHIRHCDHLVKTLAFLALVLHWFNPAVWLSYFLMARDMEMFCDESVLRESTKEDRISYSQLLLNLSVRQSRLFMPLAFGESNAKTRIKNVLRYKKPAFRVSLAAIAAVIVLIIGFSFNPKSVIEETGPVVEQPNETQPADMQEGESSEISLAEIRELAAKGDDLTFEDFSAYFGADSSSDLNYKNLLYSVEGDFRLLVRGSGSGRPDAVTLEYIWTSGGIDIRYGYLDDFLAKYEAWDSGADSDSSQAVQAADASERTPLSEPPEGIVNVALNIPQQQEMYRTAYLNLTAEEQEKLEGFIQQARRNERWVKPDEYYSTAATIYLPSGADGDGTFITVCGLLEMPEVGAIREPMQNGYYEMSEEFREFLTDLVERQANMILFAYGRRTVSDITQASLKYPVYTVDPKSDLRELDRICEQTVTDSDSLRKLEALMNLTGDKINYGAPGCSFGAALTLTKADGSEIWFSLATDSCSIALTQDGVFMNYSDDKFHPRATMESIFAEIPWNE